MVKKNDEYELHLLTIDKNTGEQKPVKVYYRNNPKYVLTPIYTHYEKSQNTFYVIAQNDKENIVGRIKLD